MGNEPDFDLSPHRFKRYLTIRDLPKREEGHCRWCGAKCEGRRRRWCSKGCDSEYLIRAGFIEEPVKKRDKGICAICHIDADSIEKQVKQWGRTVPYDIYLSFCRWLGMTRDPYKRWWDIDHIIPVIEGGGCCGLDNLRTVCFMCHKEETKALAGRRAKAKPVISDTFT